MNIIAFLILDLSLLLAWPAWAADIQISVDRNPVGSSESFKIIFTANQSPDDQPDFSPLQQDFEILDQQRSSNAAWINGHASHNERWIITAMAKKTGELLIPAIAFGADHSKPLPLTVIDSGQTAHADADLFLEVSATPETPYVQAQVLYTLRVYRRVQITQAKLDDPQLTDAVVEKLGEDNNYSTQLRGVEYWVTERRYAIFPQHSGNVTISPLKLTAEVLSGRRSRFSSFFSPDTETRRVASKAITLNVQPMPASFKNLEWLTAESLQLNQEWSNQDLQIKVGEPITRTLTLIAQAATVGELPELAEHMQVDGMKIYPDQPVLKEEKQNDGLTAIREEKIAFIPSRPGEYKLPAIAVPWFNTRTQRMETARLPEITVTALADETEPSIQANNASPAQSPAMPAMATTVSESYRQELRLWQISTAVLALAWLTTCYLLYRKPGQLRPAAARPDDAPPASDGMPGLKRDLEHACRENRPETVKQLLLHWGKARYDADSLTALARQCTPSLRQEIERLNQHLYSVDSRPWQGEALWQAFSRQDVLRNEKAAKAETLEPLHRL